MKKEELKKNAVWLVPLGLVVICLCVFLAAKASGKPEEPAKEEPLRESVTKQVKEAEATSMHLRKKQGQLNITDGDGKDCPPRDRLGLYSGYHLLTQLESYAWIGLDDVKLAKMDENSEMGIRKEGKALTLFLSSGGVFFNVTEPLPEDETFNIRCSSMGIGIRGTCGWVQMTEDKHVMVYLLEGNVECKVTDGAGEVTNVTVSAGEVGDLYVTPEGVAEVEVVPFAENYVAPFVMDELTADPELSALVLEVAGLDVINPPDPVERLNAEYQEIINSRPLYSSVSDGLFYADYVDFENDGVPELLMMSAETSEEDFSIKFEVYGDKQGYAVKYGEGMPGGYGPTHIGLYQNGERWYVGYSYDTNSSGGGFGEGYYGVADNSFVPTDIIGSYGGRNEADDGWISLFFTYTDETERDTTDEAETEITYDQYTAISEKYESKLPIIYYAFTIDREIETRGILPELPADVQRRAAFMDALNTGTVKYARLIDMNADGTEELFVALKRGQWSYQCRAYTWDGVTANPVDFDSDYRTSIYREKATGIIYMSTIQDEGSATNYKFTNLSGDEVFYNFMQYSDHIYDEVYSSYEGGYVMAMDLPAEEFEAYMAPYDTQIEALQAEMDARFELIEEIPSGDEARTNVEAVRQQLLNG